MLWQDSIMGHPPLANYEDLKDIHEWLSQHGVLRLEDISIWDEIGNWQSWAFPRVPEHLQSQQNILRVELTDSAVVHKQALDSWGWGNIETYSATQGFMYLQSQHETNQLETFWKQVRDSFGLPKINFFLWVLMHNKILTGENVIKRSIVSPHICALCRNALETMDHLFMDCTFTKDVWNLSFKVSMSQSQPKSLWLIYFPLGRCAIHMQFPASLFDFVFGIPSPNTPTGKFGLQEMSRFSIALLGPPRRLQPKPKILFFKQ